jgi:transcriptional regulator with XRE-family HTH domain
MDVGDDVTQRLNDAMNERRIDLGLKWTDVARRAGVSKETVLRFRSGPRTPETTAKIERALGWPRGYLDAIAAGEPPPTAASRVGELEQLRDLAATLQDNIDALLRRLDELDGSNGAHRATS